MCAFPYTQKIGAAEATPSNEPDPPASMPRRTTEADEDSVRVAASAALAGVCSGGSRMPEAKACLLFGCIADEGVEGGGEGEVVAVVFAVVFAGCQDGSCQYSAHSVCSWRVADVTGSATTAAPAPAPASAPAPAASEDVLARA